MSEPGYQEFFCLACGENLHPGYRESSYTELVFPDNGVIFKATGNYGSQLYDPLTGGQWLEIVVCDSCVAVAAELGRIRKATAVRDKNGDWDEPTYVKWSVDDDGDND
jgi:hypothetical protein